MMRQRSSFDGKRNVFVFHTARFVDNPMIRRVILINNNVDDLNHLISGCMASDENKDKVRQVYIHGKIADALNIREDFRGLVKVFAETKREIIENSKVLKERKWYICPVYPVEKREDISFITSMGIAVDLLYQIEQMKEEVILNILDYYLHHPSLAIPIEPFHAILMSKLKRQSLHLWNLYLIFPGLFFHVDDTGMAEEPDQLIKRDYLFFIDRETHEFKKNVEKKGNESRLKGYFETIPKNHPGCMSCVHFHCCFSWAKYNKDSCRKWKMILDRVQTSVKEIEGIKGATPNCRG